MLTFCLTGITAKTYTLNVDIIVRQKNPDAVALGKLGASKGGLARAASMTPEQRSALARKAVNSRWEKQPKRHTFSGSQDNNFKIGKMRPGEYAFFRIMQDKGVTLEYLTQSVSGLFKLHRGCYTPDFYDRIHNIHYEVSSSRQAFSQGCTKYLEMQRKHPHIKLVVVKPDGTEITLNGS